MKFDHLLHTQEGKTLEFKRDLSSPENFIKTLVAFANTAGGIMLIGVEDDHSVIGITGNPLDKEERLSTYLFNCACVAYWCYSSRLKWAKR